MNSRRQSRCCFRLRLLTLPTRKRARGAVVVGLSAALLGCCLLLPGLAWSARTHHWLNKLAVKADVKVAKWRGHQPKLAAITGTLKRSEALDEALKGARIEAIDSPSGWATLTDSQGTFTLPDLLWYPDGKWSLIVSLGLNNVRRIDVSLPRYFPNDGVISLGDLFFDSGCPVDMAELQGSNSIHKLAYETENTQYYRGLFSDLTGDQAFEDEKFEAINRHVAKKLACDGQERRPIASRQVLEEGSCYCGALSLAFAAIAEAGGYKSRLLDLSAGESNPGTHMVVEVYYDEGWHLYDPALGVALLGPNGRVASYRDLRVNPELIDRCLLRAQGRISMHLGGGSIQEVYRSGLHHFYSFRDDAVYTLW
jgi:Transglutaminase-like superfamily